jgi:hypothetical protein
MIKAIETKEKQHGAAKEEADKIIEGINTQHLIEMN